MDSPARGSEIFSNSLLEFQKACVWANKSRNNFANICELYKAILDGNFTGRFCIGDHCKTIYMIEIKFDGCKWGVTPKTFYSEEEAEREVEALKIKYPFISDFRVVARKEKEKND